MTTKKIKNNLKGFDEHGQVFELEHTIFRKIQDEYKSEVARLYQSYSNERLDKKGIVETKLLCDGNLEHKKYTISYPHEWSPNMFKDAVLFHVKLLYELDRYGLTLKDALPNNIVFNFTSPVFVDFLSLVFFDKLKDEKWLNAGNYRNARFAVINIMLIPYMIMPLVAMSKGEYSLARELLSSRSCNCEGRPPKWSELICPRIGFGIKSKKYIRTLMLTGTILWNRWLARIYFLDFANFMDKLVHIVNAINVTPPKSGYSFYYNEKAEDTSLDSLITFLPKQRTVHEIIVNKKPKTVLDIGANTGWYSLLASKLGADVISLEQDESCVDILYDIAKKNRLNILPLKMAFGDLVKGIYGIAYTDTVYKDRNFDKTYLYRPGIERFKSELVLFLGISHHLVLGEGYKIEELFDILSPLTQKTLVLEFVDITDEKILKEPSFFRNLNGNDSTAYNLNRFIEVGKRHFACANVFDSNPQSRKIVVFDK